eukprot:12420194-Karenia_brevis.AAC.1
MQCTCALDRHACRARRAGRSASALCKTAAMAIERAEILCNAMHMRIRAPLAPRTSLRLLWLLALIAPWLLWL